MAPFPWECVLYPIPILMTAYGLKAETPAGKFIGLVGAILWIFGLGFDGTCIAVVSLLGWWFIILILKVLFTPRGW